MLSEFNKTDAISIYTEKNYLCQDGKNYSRQNGEHPRLLHFII